MHQDAHEFLNFLLHQISECIDKKTKEDEKTNSQQPQSSRQESVPGVNTPTPTSHGPDNEESRKNWIEKTFQGKLVHQTKCLTCETVTCMEEVFFDLHLPIEHNCSLTSCLRKYRLKSN